MPSSSAAGLRDFYVVGPAASFHPAAAAAAAPFHSSALTAAPYLWQSQPLINSPQPFATPQNPNPNSTTSALESSTCQDCGNQAKKDCSHRRCRTCCKSRGYDCSTHIKSTWVSAARRRERHLTAASSVLKKPRLLSSQTTTTSDSGSSHQDPSFRENLPGHVRAPAVFKCVRVTSIDDGEDEYAYHAKVNIGGHVFKGFLYNQGFDETGTSTAAVDFDDNVNGTSNAIPNFSELHLGGGGVRNNVPHSDIYGLGGLLGGGAAFGNAIN